MRSTSLFALIAAAWLAASPALAETLVALGRLTADGDFAGKAGETARDVSGLACMPNQGGVQRCLLIDDEGGFAQFAQIAGNRITPGAPLPILGEAAAMQTLGSPPAPTCARQGAFAELDGEAVAYADRAFYVAGSHGCSRKKGEFRLSAFHLARIRVDAAGARSGGVELTYRLSDILRQAADVAPYFGRSPMQENGLNIEGIAVVGDTLWAGLRAPSLNGRAFIVGASLAAVFAPGHERATTAPVLLRVPVGGERGIRDLAALADGRLLALVGPAQEQDLPYELLLLDPARPEAATSLGTLRDLRDGKAETLTVLAEMSGQIEILIGYDGRKNGHFERYRLRTP